MWLHVVDILLQKLPMAFTFIWYLFCEPISLLSDSAMMELRDIEPNRSLVFAVYVLHLFASHPGSCCFC